jgi:hypothetical protein
MAASSFGISWATITTFAPFEARCLATDSPSPWEPPVIMAVYPKQVRETIDDQDVVQTTFLSTGKRFLLEKYPIAIRAMSASKPQRIKIE